MRSFVDTWPTLSVEVRRDVAGALLTSVRVFQDKTVEIPPNHLGILNMSNTGGQVLGPLVMSGVVGAFGSHGPG